MARSENFMENSDDTWGTSVCVCVCVVNSERCEKYKQRAGPVGDRDQWVDNFKRGSAVVLVFVGVVLEVGFSSRGR